MTMQKRPLTGMVTAAGAALPVAVTVAAVTLHTLDRVATTSGGPFPDVISLWVSNIDVAARILTLAIGGVTFQAVSIPASSIVQVLVEVPFKSPTDAAAATLTAAAPGANQLVCWGWFARPL